MSYRWLAIAAIVVCSSLSGCCGLHQVGPGCVDSCEQCDGCWGHPIPCTPLDGFCQLCRSTVCSGGCGEVYYGEWASTPPDCVDPCDPCGDYAGGCNAKCYPGVRIKSFLSCLHGKRLRCDTTPDVFDICSICRHACCVDDCSSCPSCCGDDSYIEGESVISEGETFIESDGLGSSRAMPSSEGSQFRPIPRARTVSTSSMPTRRSSSSSCNCGKH